MGVFGLWRLLDASGKPVPLETLEGKVLAVDVSIWIHQVLQGYQDRHGNPKPNAHLLGLFHRICKLLYYKIKPVFVFDGGVPMLKKNTIASRRKQKSLATSKAQKMKADLINNLIKHTAVKTVLNKEDAPVNSSEASKNLQKQSTINDMFILPEMPNVNKIEACITDNEYDSDSSIELSPRKQSKWIGNIHQVDVSSKEFKALPADVRYDILTDLKDTRKQNSWGRLHEMPKASHDFSGFQMSRLLKRRLVQESLESAEREMGGKTLTLDELEKLLTEQGVNTTARDTAYRIASDSTTRLIYISDKNALAEKIDNDNSSKLFNTIVDQKPEPIPGPSGTLSNDVDKYEENYLLDSDVESINSNTSVPLVDNIHEYAFDSDWDSENELNQSQPLAKKYFGKTSKKTSTNTDYENPALTYMLEHSGLCQDEIITLIEKSKKDNIKATKMDTKIDTNIDTQRLKTIQPHNQQNIDMHKNVSTEDNSSIRVSTEKIYMETENHLGMKIKRAQENTAIHEIVKFNSDSEYSDCADSEEIIDASSNNMQLNVTSKNMVETSQSVKHSTDAIMNTTICVDTTESSSDDFIEIADVPIFDTQNLRKTTTGNIQITVKPDRIIEDDIFADVFEKSKRNIVMISSSSPVPLQDNAESDKPVKNKTSTMSAIDQKPFNARAETNVTAADNGETKPDIQASSEKHTEESRNTADTATENLQELANSSLAVDSTPLPVDKEELLSLKTHLEDEQKELSENIGKLERQATDITDQIRIEAQELLKLFGLPYIVAPMEAEAQCAYLEEIKLTDGTITDDSDIWLFGGQCVYKHFFNHRKQVLRFQSCDIQHHFKLTRNQLIQLALLVGSDYTTGISGIGPVTALEILAVFPSEGDNLLCGLTKFCSWVKAGRTVGLGKTALRNKLRNVAIEKGFPSQAVVQAYLFPTIDESKEKFSWGKPNAVLLFDYVRKKFGWNKNKFDDIIIPVLKKVEENNKQKGIDSFFKVQATPKSIEANLSKRVQKALLQMNNDSGDEEQGIKSMQKENPKTIAKSKTQKLKTSKPVNEEQPVTLKNSNAEQTTIIKAVEDKSSFFEKLPPEPPTPVAEHIPQREKDKANALKKKLHAIEVFRKSNRGLSKTKKVKRSVRKIVKEAALSESSSDSS